jgi:integrase
MAGKQRSYGTGSVRQQGGRWEARFYGPDGMRRSLYARTEREAERALRRALAQVDAGQAPAPEKLTVADYLTSWLETTARPRLRPRTFDSYAMIVNRHLVAALGSTRLARLTPADVRGYLADKLAAGLSARTCAYHRAILRKALHDAMRDGLLGRNVAALADPPKQTTREQQWLDAEQARAFIEEAQRHRLHAAWVLAVTSGLRQVELLGLRWADVDLDRGELRVAQQLQRVGGKLQLLPLKTDKSRRTVPLAGIALEALKAHRVRQIEERLAAGQLWQDSGLLFTTALGGAVEPRNVVRSFKQLLQRAGLPIIRFHDLRHSAASLLLAAGADLKAVSDLLGHAQIGLTLDTYSHLTAGHKRAAVDRLGALLG